MTRMLKEYRSSRDILVYPLISILYINFFLKLLLLFFNVLGNILSMIESQLKERKRQKTGGYLNRTRVDEAE